MRAVVKTIARIFFRRRRRRQSPSCLSKFAQNEPVTTAATGNGAGNGAAGSHASGAVDDGVKAGARTLAWGMKAGELGFEPRLNGPEPFVLPLHYSPNPKAWLPGGRGGRTKPHIVSLRPLRTAVKDDRTASLRRMAMFT